METRHSHISNTKVRSGVPRSIENPLRPEWFEHQRLAYLGASLGLTQFGVNHLRLETGAYSSLRHWHEGEDEFVLVMSGTAILNDENGEAVLEAGAYAAFPAGQPNAHHLTNRQDEGCCPSGHWLKEARCRKVSLSR